MLKSSLRRQSLTNIFLTVAVLVAVFFGTHTFEESPPSAFKETIQHTSLADVSEPFANNFNYWPPAAASVSVTARQQNAAVPIAPTTPPPAVNAQVVYVKLLDSNTELAATESQYQWPIASITKLMTAVVALEKFTSTTTITVTQTAVDTEGDAGALAVNGIYSVRDLIKAMMLVSSNDAASALAEAYGKEKFISAMRRTAANLEMNDTNYSDSTGLSFLNQSTVRDLEKLIVYIRAHHPEILAFTTASQETITDLLTHATTKLNNINYFSSWSQFLGGKTGFITESKGNLISLFNFQGSPLLIIVLGTDDRFKDTEMLYNWVVTSVQK